VGARVGRGRGGSTKAAEWSGGRRKAAGRYFLVFRYLQRLNEEQLVFTGGTTQLSHSKDPVTDAYYTI